MALNFMGEKIGRIDLKPAQAGPSGRLEKGCWRYEYFSQFP
jgi:hypothetical protein